MLNRIREIIFLLIFIFVIWFIFHERESAKNEVKIEQLQEEKKIDEGVIHTKNFQQKLISKPERSIDVAARDEWLHLLWEKADHN